MAKTIHKMAVKYGRLHQGTVDIEVYEAGANYVLDEVESVLLDKELYCEEMCNALIALVEQLKK